ncbi:MAG: glycerol kinase [Acidobacteriota bacterium]|nr:glycerol kinase [Acidobacteriota bacterium]
MIVAVDAGTTGVRSVAIGEQGQVRGWRYQEFPQYFPRPGWVEHDPWEIWEAVSATLAGLLADLHEPVVAIGLAVQRETTVLWDRRSGHPLAPAVVWQDRRTAEACERLRAEGHLDLIRARTGLVLDPYFSATKLAWLLGDGGVSPDADTAFGTVDSWLIWCLSGGRAHVTDTTNAARTLLLDIHTLTWDDELAAVFGVPSSVLPEIAPSSARVAVTAEGVVGGLPGGIPISGVAGDQQASLFGQACTEAGMTKNTYGTGSFVLMNVGSEAPRPADGLLTTVAWSIGEVSPAATSYALEGAVFVTGAAVQWLRDGLGVISESAEIGPLAESVADSGGAVFVPALTGLGSPWWDPNARGTILGLSRGVGRAHLARAVVEAMAFQTADVVGAMRAACGRDIPELRIDGGASVMDLLLQLQSDVLDLPVRRTASADSTALGAAYLAGVAEGVWDLGDITAMWSANAEARPGPARDGVLAAYQSWGQAVRRAVGWP